MPAPPLGSEPAIVSATATLRSNHRASGNRNLAGDGHAGGICNFDFDRADLGGVAGDREGSPEQKRAADLGGGEIFLKVRRTVDADVARADHAAGLIEERERQRAGRTSVIE